MLSLKHLLDKIPKTRYRKPIQFFHGGHREACELDDFICANGQCVAGSSCDGVKQCATESDQADCLVQTSPCNEFKRPHNDICIGEWRVCDNTKDCSIGSDLLKRLFRFTQEPRYCSVKSTHSGLNLSYNIRR